MSDDDYAPWAPISVWYDYTTKCPQCGHQQAQGAWSRPDVTYAECALCGYQGDLTVTVRERREENRPLPDHSPQN